MQGANKKPRSILGRGIGACVSTHKRKKTEMNATTRKNAPAIKAKLSAVMSDTSRLTQAESKMLSAARKLDQHDFDFIVRMMTMHAHNNPATAIVKGKPEFVLIHGGAA